MKKLNKAKAIKLIALIITIAILIIATIYMIPVIKQINTPEGQAEFKEKITNSGIRTSPSSISNITRRTSRTISRNLFWTNMGNNISNDISIHSNSNDIFLCKKIWKRLYI